MPEGTPPQINLGTTVETTDATVTTLWTLATRPDRMYAIKFMVVASETTDHDEGALYFKMALFKNDGGTLALIGSAQDLGTPIESDGSWTGPTVDASSSDIRIRVAGKAATNIKWRAIVDAYEVG